MIFTRKGKKLAKYGSFPVILSPYFDRGVRIGARIPAYEEREIGNKIYICNR
jgi:hypothetical protein